MSTWEDMKANGKLIAALEFDLAEARAQIAAKDAALDALYTERHLFVIDKARQELQVQIAAKDAELARLQKALLTCAAIPHMGQYTGSQVRAAIEESKPWSGQETKPTGVWPDWGDSPRGFDGPGGAE
jgi:hypothetical protein